jgi:molecular chaperone GrpE
MAMTDNGIDVTTETQTNHEAETAEQIGTQGVGEAGSASGEGQDTASTTAAADPIAALRESNEQLRAERDNLLERLARLQAEFDNARKREQRERSDYRSFAIADAVEQFLPVLDNFRLALNSTGSVEQMRTGVELIAKQMEEVLRSLSVTPIETVGQPFDPRVHEALDSVERNDLPDHQVIEEVRRGYKIKDRLLRPALVRIAVNSHVSQA